MLALVALWFTLVVGMTTYSQNIEFIWTLA
jgi:hypothetical protein